MVIQTNNPRLHGRNSGWNVWIRAAPICERHKNNTTSNLPSASKCVGERLLVPDSKIRKSAIGRNRHGAGKSVRAARASPIMLPNTGNLFGQLGVSTATHEQKAQC